MQFFYIDYMNNGKKERNIGFLRVENDGVSVGLRGVPLQCGDCCKVYAVNIHDERILLGDIAVRSGYGMEKMKWNDKVDFARCMRVEIPLYGTRMGVCVLRDDYPSQDSAALVAESAQIHVAKSADRPGQAVYEELCEEVCEDKWQQLCRISPEIHICRDAQSILIRPRDAVVLAEKYHELATNSFVLHAYYNYRQLLLFRYAQGDAKYYLGVPGVYYEREQRIAQMFGFEGFENGEARMQQDADNKLYKGCFGYYMKRVEI